MPSAKLPAADGIVVEFGTHSKKPTPSAWQRPGSFSLWKKIYSSRGKDLRRPGGPLGNLGTVIAFNSEPYRQRILREAYRSSVRPASREHGPITQGPNPPSPMGESLGVKSGGLRSASPPTLDPLWQGLSNLNRRAGSVSDRRLLEFRKNSGRSPSRLAFAFRCLILTTSSQCPFCSPTP